MKADREKWGGVKCENFLDRKAGRMRHVLQHQGQRGGEAADRAIRKAEREGLEYRPQKGRKTVFLGGK